MTRSLQLMLLAAACLVLFACERERRDFRTPTSAASPGTAPAPQSPLEPGNPDPNRVTAMTQQPMSNSGHPPEVEPKTAMPDMGITEQDSRDIAAYLYSFD